MEKQHGGIYKLRYIELADTSAVGLVSLAIYEKANFALIARGPQRLRVLKLIRAHRHFYSPDYQSRSYFRFHIFVLAFHALRTFDCFQILFKAKRAGLKFSWREIEAALQVEFASDVAPD